MADVPVSAAATTPAPAPVEVNKDAPAATPPAQQQATPESKPPETAKEQAKPADQAPIEIKLPDGWKKDAPEVTQFLEMAKKGPLTPQGVIDYFATIQANQAKQLQAVRAADEEALKKELGGNYDKTVKDANGFLDRAPGGKDLKALLSIAFLDTHPVIRKFLAGLNGLIAEDGVSGKVGEPSAPADSRTAELKKMFPNSPGMFQG